IDLQSEGSGPMAPDSKLVRPWQSEEIGDPSKNENCIPRQHGICEASIDESRDQPYEADEEQNQKTVAEGVCELGRRPGAGLNRGWNHRRTFHLGSSTVRTMSCMT